MFYHGRFNSLFKCLADLYMKHIIKFYVTNNATDYDNFVVPLQPCFAKTVIKHRKTATIINGLLLST